ncbi:MAG: YggS family pyridoxal phosphate-dependent enzyme [Fidelibacterota bacterium]
MIDEASLSNVRERIEKALLRTYQQSKHQQVEVVAVTKGFPHEAIINAAKFGLTSIGENRVQEAESKFAKLPNDIMINRRLVGHLQSNKAHRAVDLFDTIDSVDSLKLAKKLSSLGKARSSPLNILLQVNVDRDPAKKGFNPIATEDLLEVIDMEGLNVSGLMTIGTLTTDQFIKRETFQKLRRLRTSLNNQLSPKRRLEHLSMGMSGDFEIAIEEGATMVRIGTALFGARPST